MLNWKIWQALNKMIGMRLILSKVDFAWQAQFAQGSCNLCHNVMAQQREGRRHCYWGRPPPSSRRGETDRKLSLHAKKRALHTACSQSAQNSFRYLGAKISHNQQSYMKPEALVQF